MRHLLEEVPMPFFHALERCYAYDIASKGPSGEGLTKFQFIVDEDLVTIFGVIDLQGICIDDQLFPWLIFDDL